MDLSIQAFTSAQFVEFVRSSSQLEQVRVLELSGSRNVTAETVFAIFESLPQLERIILLDTGVSEADIPTLLATAPPELCGLIHPAMFRHSNDIPARFSFFATTPSGWDGAQPPTGMYGASTPFLSPRRIVQCLIDAFTLYENDPHPRNPYIQAAFAAGLRDPATPWSQRSITHKPVAKVVKCGDVTVPAAMVGEGWMFMQMGEPDLDIHPLWSIVRFVRRAEIVAHPDGALILQDFEPVYYGLRAFLDAIADRGAPAAPEDVDRLEKMLPIENRSAGMFKDWSDVPPYQADRL
jgi:hypothetical protein